MNAEREMSTGDGLGRIQTYDPNRVYCPSCRGPAEPGSRNRTGPDHVEYRCAAGHGYFSLREPFDPPIRKNEFGDPQVDVVVTVDVAAGGRDPAEVAVQVIRDFVGPDCDPTDWGGRFAIVRSVKAEAR